jgi:outer membrane immunogenic protein
LESGCHVGCRRGPDAKPGHAAAAWPNSRIAPDQWRIFRWPTWRKLADRAAIFGIQADAHWADIEGHGSCFDAGAVATAGLSFGCNDKVSSFGTVTGRVGAAVDRALIYAKGGWAWEFGQHSLNPTAPFNVMGGNNSQSSITADSSSQFRTGWTFGAGIEYAFAQNWSALIEYSYLDFGTKSANSTHLLSQPNNVPASFVIPIMATATERFNIVKAGLNYKFNWWSGP